LLLVDGDAYGFEIASVYKFGSVRMNHEKDGLICPKAEWIGLTVEDISE
jgi:meiotic recombination protein SPO11